MVSAGGVSMKLSVVNYVDSSKLKMVKLHGFKSRSKLDGMSLNYPA